MSETKELDISTLRKERGKEVDNPPLYAKYIKDSKELVENASKLIKKYQTKELTPIKFRKQYMNTNLLGGLYPGNVIGIAGSSGHGKSTLLQELEDDIFNDELNPDNKDYILVRNNYEVNGKGKISNFIANSYVTIIRGTPVILQLMIIYYVIFKSSDVNILIVGILAFGINSGAYVSEIIRSGINAIDKGQLEAGLALGLSYAKVMRLVIMPQAIKNILPALGNEFITLLKETSVGAYIGILELTKASDIIASRTYDYFFPLIVIALIYLALTYFLSKLVNLLERKIGNARS